MKLQRVCCRLHPFTWMEEIKEGLKNFSMDVAHIGRTMSMLCLLCIVLSCFISVLF
jgi:hypothetical protein